MDPALIKTRKQTYLKQCIIESGYSPDDFLAYSLKIKTNGDDIDNWTEDELRAVVEAYREQPDVFFAHNQSWRMKDRYNSVELSHIGKDKFAVRVQEAPNPVHRTLSDIAWVFKAAQAEHRHLYLLPMPQMDLQESTPGEILSDSETQVIRYFLEYLHLFYYLRDFQTVRLFFTLPEDRFKTFRASHKPTDGPVQSCLNAFNASAIAKKMTPSFRQALSFPVSGKMAESLNYPKYMGKFLEKSVRSWSRVTKTLGEIDGLLTKLSGAYKGLSESMLELYSCADKLDSVLNRTDPENKQFFLTAHKIFAHERRVTRQAVRGQANHHGRRLARHILDL